MSADLPPIHGLFEPHVHDLVVRSGLTVETITTHGLHSGSRQEVYELLKFGAGTGLIIPYPGTDYVRVKLDNPRSRKYLSPKGSKNRLYIPKTITAETLKDATAPLYFVEGEKKALKACQEGLHCIGLSGVWGWRTSSEGYKRGGGKTLGDLDQIVFKGRTVYIVFDSDLADNEKVQEAEAAFAKELIRRGAVVFRIPLAHHEGEKQGLDDYLVRCSIESFCAISPVSIIAAEATTNGAHRPVLVRLSEVEPESVTWAWKDRLAVGKIALIIGDPGGGKTYLTSGDLASRITRGMAWPDGGIAPIGDVILLTSEDGIADTLRPRMDKVGGDPARVCVLRGVKDKDDAEAPFNLEHDLVALDHALDETGAVLIIIDPLSAYLGTKDSYKDAEIRAILSPLAQLAERRRVAILGVLHLTKDQQRRLLMRAQGSIAFVAQARTVMAVGADPDIQGRRLLIGVKNNLGQIPATLAFRISDDGLAWESGTVEGNPEELLQVDDPSSRSERRERDSAVTFLKDMLKDGPVASKQLQADAKENGIAQRTLWRAKDEIGVQAERAATNSGKVAWYWRLPSGGF